MSGETWPKESQRLRNGASGQVPVSSLHGNAMSGQELPDAVLDAAWDAIDVAEHLVAGFVDALQNPPNAGSDWPIERIAAEANPSALAMALAAWLNACAAVYQPPKASEVKP
jgi:hypothetical protein